VARPAQLVEAESEAVTEAVTEQEREQEQAPELAPVQELAQALELPAVAKSRRPPRFLDSRSRHNP